MCSTPRASYRRGQSHRHIVTISNSSSSLIMNNASVYYVRLQKELVKRRKKQIEDEKAYKENTG